MQVNFARSRLPFPGQQSDRDARLQPPKTVTLETQRVDMAAELVHAVDDLATKRENAQQDGGRASW
jgi:hypothetical protein